MNKFTELPAYNRLKEISENPIDLTAKEGLIPKRIDQMIAGGDFNELHLEGSWEDYVVI